MKKILFLTFIFLTYFKSFACSCNDQPYEKAIDWADEIFIGRLIKINQLYSIDYEQSEQASGKKYIGAYYAEFEIEKKWKGNKRKYIKIYQKSNSCTLDFSNLGKKYLVYAKNEDLFGFKIKVATTWLCSRTYPDPEYVDSGKTYNDIPKLNKSFPNLIKINKIYINWLSILKWISILSIGFFFGYKLKKRTNTSNQQVQ